MPDVVHLEGAKLVYLRTFEDRDKTDDQLLAYFSGSLFDWSRARELTSSDSIPMFLSSLLCN